MRLLLHLLAVLMLGLALPAIAQEPAADPPATAQGESDLAVQLAVPFASGLVGARDVPVFAWTEYAAGVRNIWVARAGERGRQRTTFSEDDGIAIHGLALNATGSRLAFVRGGDADFTDERPPNTGWQADAPDPAIYLLDLAGNAAAQAIGQGYEPMFSPDGDRIAFAKDGAIMIWDAAGGARTVARVTGQVGDLQWSPDGGTIVFREMRGGHSLIGIVTLVQARLRYLGATLGHASDPALSPDGREVAFIQYREAPARFGAGTGSFWSVRVADIATGAVRTVWTVPEGEGGQYYGTRGRNLFWTASGHLVFPDEGSGWLHVLAVPAAGGEARDLTPGANEVENFVPTPDGRGIVYAANPGDLDSRSLWRIDIGSARAQRLTPESTFAFYPVFAGERLAATISDARRPAHMALVDPLEPLGQAHEIAAFRQPEVVTFAAEDGLEVHAQLFRGAGAGPRPAVIFAHGGPRRQMLPAIAPIHYYHNAYIRNQALAAAGYDVLSINYRSGTNYGRAFREAPDTGREGASEYRDIIAGARWLAQRDDIDPSRIGIWGGSWGGYLVALALSRNSDLFAAGVDLHGVHAMVRPVPEGFSPEEVLAIQQKQWDSSPMGTIAAWRSPVLIVHGDDDRNVPYRQSLLLASELAARGVPFEEIALPNERHGFFRHANWVHVLGATGDFLDRHLKAGR